MRGEDREYGRREVNWHQRVIAPVARRGQVTIRWSERVQGVGSRVTIGWSVVLSVEVSVEVSVGIGVRVRVSRVRVGLLKSLQTSLVGMRPRRHIQTS